MMGPLEERARCSVGADLAPHERDHAVSRTQAAFESMLGEQNRRPPLLVEPAQQTEQLVAGDRVELRGRLVEHEQTRAPGEGGAERDPLELAAGEIDGRALEQPLDAEHQSGLLDATRHRNGAVAAVLQRERQLRSHRAHHDLRLGVLEERPDHTGKRCRPMLAKVHAADLRPAFEAPAVKVRDQAAGQPEQRRLAAGRSAGQHDEFALRDLERDLTQRRGRRSRIGVGDAGELERVHRLMPRRCANGASTASASAPASTSVVAPNDPWIWG